MVIHNQNEITPHYFYIVIKLILVVSFCFSHYMYTNTRHFFRSRKQLGAYPQTHSASEDITIRMRLMNEGKCHKCRNTWMRGK